MKIREEYFTALREGKEECLCRIILPFSECVALSGMLEEIYDRVRGVCESGDLVRRYEKDRDSRERFSVTPYRYLCRGTLYKVDEGIVSCRIDSSLDARFPGGVHILRTDGFLYDEKAEMIISAESIIPSDIRRAMKGKGRICASYADADGIHLLLSDKNECLCPTERFISCYQGIKKYISHTRKKEKKGIDKSRKL